MWPNRLQRVIQPSVQVYLPSSQFVEFFFCTSRQTYSDVVDFFHPAQARPDVFKYWMPFFEGCD